MSFYAGPDKPRFSASNWEALESAASTGVFDETAWVELKKDVPAKSVAANLELARDLASLSVDGGTLIIGVSDKTKDVVGVTAVASVADRVIQVAAGRVMPPLYVVPVAVSDPRDPTKSVLVVSVPASASAPHMVDERYWGRTAQGKRTLSDPEVDRLIAARTGRQANLRTDIRGLSSLDLHLSSERKHGHMYVLIRPSRPPATRLADVVKDREVTTYVWGGAHKNDFKPSYPPMNSGLGYTLPHPDGYLVASSTPDDDVKEASSLRVLLRDSGAVECVWAGATRPYGRDDDAPEVIAVGALIELVHGLVNVAADLGADHLAYWGEWDAAVFIDRLAGVLPSQNFNQVSFNDFHPYPNEDYYRETRTTTQEMSDRPQDVVARLMEPFAKGLGLGTRCFPYEHPNEIAKFAR